MVDAMPRSAPASGRAATRPLVGESPEARAAAREERRVAFSERLQARIARHRATPPDQRTQLVTLSLRVEADEDELVAGSVRVVLQVHDEQNPLHVADAALLWTESGA